MKKEFGIFEPEVIDQMVIARLGEIKESLKPKNERTNGRTLVASGWREDELELRHMVILDYIRQGLSRKRVVEEICNRWGIAPKVGYDYYSKALKYLADINKADDLEDIKNRQLERLEGIVEQALERNNYQDATKALDLVNKLNGLYTEKANLTIDGEIKFEFE